MTYCNKDIDKVILNTINKRKKNNFIPILNINIKSGVEDDTL